MIVAIIERDNIIVGNLSCMDQDVYVYSRGKQQRQGYFDAKMPALSDDDTDEFYSKIDI